MPRARHNSGRAGGWWGVSRWLVYGWAIFGVGWLAKWCDMTALGVSMHITSLFIFGVHLAKRIWTT